MARWWFNSGTSMLAKAASLDEALLRPDVRLTGRLVRRHWNQSAEIRLRVHAAEEVRLVLEHLAFDPRVGTDEHSVGSCTAWIDDQSPPMIRVICVPPPARKSRTNHWWWEGQLLLWIWMRFAAGALSILSRSQRMGRPVTSSWSGRTAPVAASKTDIAERLHVQSVFFTGIFDPVDVIVIGVPSRDGTILGGLEHVSVNTCLARPQPLPRWSCTGLVCPGLQQMQTSQSKSCSAIFTLPVAANRGHPSASRRGTG